MATLRDNYEAIINELERGTNKKVGVIEGQVKQNQQETNSKIKALQSKIQTVSNSLDEKQDNLIFAESEEYPYSSDNPVPTVNYIKDNIKAAKLVKNYQSDQADIEAIPTKDGYTILDNLPIGTELFFEETNPTIFTIIGKNEEGILLFVNYLGYQQDLPQIDAGDSDYQTEIPKANWLPNHYENGTQDKFYQGTLEGDVGYLSRILTYDGTTIDFDFDNILQDKIIKVGIYNDNKIYDERSPLNETNEWAYYFPESYNTIKRKIFAPSISDCLFPLESILHDQTSGIQIPCFGCFRNNTYKIKQSSSYVNNMALKTISNYNMGRLSIDEVRTTPKYSVQMKSIMNVKPNVKVKLGERTINLNHPFTLTDELVENIEDFILESPKSTSQVIYFNEKENKKLDLNLSINTDNNTNKKPLKEFPIGTLLYVKEGSSKIPYLIDYKDNNVVQLIRMYHNSTVNLSSSWTRYDYYYDIPSTYTDEVKQILNNFTTDFKENYLIPVSHSSNFPNLIIPTEETTPEQIESDYSTVMLPYSEKGTWSKMAIICTYTEAFKDLGYRPSQIANIYTGGISSVNHDDSIIEFANSVNSNYRTFYWDGADINSVGIRPELNVKANVLVNLDATADDYITIFNFQNTKTNLKVNYNEVMYSVLSPQIFEYYLKDTYTTTDYSYASSTLTGKATQKILGLSELDLINSHIKLTLRRYKDVAADMDSTWTDQQIYFNCIGKRPTGIIYKGYMAPYYNSGTLVEAGRNVYITITSAGVATFSYEQLSA